VVVDGDIEELQPAPGLILRVAGDAMAARTMRANLRDVEVQQVAGSGMLVAHDGHWRLQHPGLVQHSRVRMRLTVLDLSPAACAILTPVHISSGANDSKSISTKPLSLRLRLPFDKR
jgi:hypothetical protein